MVTYVKDDSHNCQSSLTGQIMYIEPIPEEASPSWDWPILEISQIPGQVRTILFNNGSIGCILAGNEIQHSIGQLY